MSFANGAARVDLSTLGDDTTAGNGAQKEETRRLLDAAAEILAFSGAGGPLLHLRHCNSLTEHSIRRCMPWRASVSVFTGL